MKSTEYWRHMTEDERVIIIEENGDWKAILAFSICDHYASYENKELWEYKNHKADGSICYVEKLLAKEWNKSIRKKLEEVILSNFPNVKFGIWQRPSAGKDRKVIFKVKNEANLRN